MQGYNSPLRAGLLGVLLGASVGARAQTWQVRSYSAGSRVFEIQELGGGVNSIGPLLRQPAAHQRYVSSLAYSGISNGGLGVARHQMYYASVELDRPTAAAVFWRQCTVQVGVLLTNQLAKGPMTVFEEQVNFEPDGTIIQTRAAYSLVQRQRFVGATLGLNRRFRLASRLQFVTGLHTQASLAVEHRYQQQWDSTRLVVPPNGVTQRTTNSTPGPDLAGRNYLQWQLFVPLGLEVDAYRNRLFVRLEANVGIVGSRLRERSLAGREAHGLGLWLGYRLPKVQK